MSNIATQIRDKNFVDAEKTIQNKLMEKLHGKLESEKVRVGQRISDELKTAVKNHEDN